MAKHAVVRTDKMAGTDVRSYLASVMYFGVDGKTETEIDNGNIVELGDLAEFETYREVYIAEAPTGTFDETKMALVANPEVMYEEGKRDLADYYNEVGKIIRVYRLHVGDIFSVTEEAFDGKVELGTFLDTKEGSTKLASAESGKLKVINIENVGKYKYYVIQVVA